MTFTHEPEIRLDGPDTFVLLDGLYYEGREDIFVVPAGFVTDFASVPRFATWLIPRFGRYTKAAILHDYLCERLNSWPAEKEAWLDRYLSGRPVRTGGPEQPPAWSRDTDGLFRRVMREEGVSWLQRWLMWTGVRWGALANPARRAGWWRDFPKVLGLSALALPIVLLPCLAVLGGQLLFWVLDLATGGGRRAGVTA